MGVIYKLQPEVKEFIIGAKKANPDLSCRRFTGLIQDKFQLKLSKSSINAVFKQEDLSMPVGRRQTRQNLIEAEGLGAILLKAADTLIGGSRTISEIINDNLKLQDPQLLAKTEALIYKQLFDFSGKQHLKSNFGLWTLINYKLNNEEINSHLIDLQTVKSKSSELFQALSKLLLEVHSVRVKLSDGAFFYFDGQLHTIWPSTNIPYEFNATIYRIKGYIENNLLGNKPLILYMAPGLESPSDEFFNFNESFENNKKEINEISLLDNKSEIIETIPIPQGKRYGYVFGLWPWQYGACRKVKLKSEFRAFDFEPLKRNFCIAEAEVELLQQADNKKVTLRGCALKTGFGEKIKVIILTNLSEQEVRLEDLTSHYLNRWPSLEETFENFNRKIELFPYQASVLPFPLADSIQHVDNKEDISILLNAYLRSLDLYVKRYFLPFGYERKDFFTLKEQFYALKGRLKKRKTNISASLLPPPNYPHLKDLIYACRRVNEREVTFENNIRLWLGVS